MKSIRHTARLAVFAALAASVVPTSAALISLETPSLGVSVYEEDWSATGGFFSSGAFFNNAFTDFGGGFTSWSGFALTRGTDTTTAGFGNQFSAIAGSGAGGSLQYAMAFPDSFGAISTITLPEGESPLSIEITNSTYAALSMRDGDAFAKKFGGVSGDDADFFKLTISGLNASNTVIGTVDFYLADFRFANNAQDYILTNWATVDLTALPADTRKLQFALASSDNGAFGMNTPAYFAVDNITTVPEPSAAGLLLLGSVAFAGRRRRA